MKKSKDRSGLPHEIYLTYQESCSGREPKNPDDRWTEYSDEIITFEPTGLFATRTSWQETIQVSFDPLAHINKPIQVMVVRYTDGNTFGRSLGHWTVIGAYLNPEDAKRIGQIIFDDVKQYEQAKWDRYGTLSSKQKDREWQTAAKHREDLFLEQTAPFVGKHFYASWKGYFASFEDIEIHNLILQKEGIVYG